MRINGERYVEEVKACNVTTFPTFIFYFCGEERERLEKADAYLLEAKIQQYTQLVLPENEDDLRSDDSSEESREMSTEEDDYMDHYPFERMRSRVVKSLSVCRRLLWQSVRPRRRQAAGEGNQTHGGGGEAVGSHSRTSLEQGPAAGDGLLSHCR